MSPSNLNISTIDGEINRITTETLRNCAVGLAEVVEELFHEAKQNEV